MLFWAPEWGGVCTRWLPRIPSLRLYWEGSDTLPVAQVLPQATVLGFKNDGSNCTPWPASAITPLQTQCHSQETSRQEINLGRESGMEHIAPLPPPSHCSHLPCVCLSMEAETKRGLNCNRAGGLQGAVGHPRHHREAATISKGILAGAAQW